MALVHTRRLAPPFSAAGLDATTDDLFCGEAASQSFVAESDSPWRYWFRADDPDGDWATSGFDDSLWDSGSGRLGFGVPDLDTEIDATSQLATTLYARTEFMVNDPSSVDDLVLELDHNDGVVVYVNGVEVLRRQLGFPGYRLPSSFPASRHSGGEFEDHRLCPSTLVEGVNTLALEVHNRALGDPSLFFHCGLRGANLAPPAPPLPEPAAGGRLHFRAEVLPNKGDRGSVLVLLDTDVPIRGVSLVIEFSPTDLVARSVSAPIEIRGGVRGASRARQASGQVSFGMVLEPDMPSLGPGEDIPVAEFRFEVLSTSSDLTRLSLGEHIATPSLRTRLAVEGGGTLIPIGEELTSEVTDSGGPYIDGFLNNTGEAGAAFFVVGGRFDGDDLRAFVCRRRDPRPLAGRRPKR